MLKFSSYLCLILYHTFLFVQKGILNLLGVGGVAPARLV